MKSSSVSPSQSSSSPLQASAAGARPSQTLAPSLQSSCALQLPCSFSRVHSSTATSSVSPLQSLSIPSQLSGSGAGALHSLNPAGPQPRVPWQLPASFSTAQTVAGRSSFDNGLHAQGPASIVRRHCLRTRPSFTRTSTQMYPPGQSRSAQLAPQKRPSAP